MADPVGMEAFVEQSLVLLLLAFTGGVGTAGLAVALAPHVRRAARRLPGPFARTVLPTDLTGAAPSTQPLPAPLLAPAPSFELAAPPHSRREARTRR